jgi:NADH pyrophosphatase NudC (nudix superfamily)
MDNRCPGQDKRNLKAEVITCFCCGHKLEIFSDEVKIICPNCKSRVYKERLPSCIDWCKAARECMGEERYIQLKVKEINKK